MSHSIHSPNDDLPRKRSEPFSLKSTLDSYEVKEISSKQAAKLLVVQRIHADPAKNGNSD